MANSRIQGITIALEGDSTPLKKALSDVDKASGKTTKELGQINRALKFDEGNTTLLAQKFEVLQEAVQHTQTRFDALKQAQAEVERQFAAGEIDASAYREFIRELETTEGKLNAFKRQAEDVNARIVTQVDTSDLDRAESKIKQLGDAAKQAGKEIGDGLKAGAVAGSAGIAGVVVGSSELSTALARLKTNASLAGVDLGVAEEGVKRLTVASGDSRAAVEAVSNLLASGLTDNQLLEAIDLTEGAYLKFSDTLSQEGIADGLQETLAIGEAAGSFAELLERSGVSLDTFNEGLAKAKANGTEANYAMEQFSSLGLQEVTDKYKELNPEVAENAEATANLEFAMADLGTALAPLITFLAEIVTKVVEFASENETLTKIIGAVLIAIGAILAILAVLGPVIGGITALAGALGIGIGAVAAPIGIVVAAIVGFFALAAVLISNWEVVPKFFSGLWDGIVKGFKFGINKIGDLASGLVGFIKKPINAMIGLLNKFITSANKIKLPDWVPAIGGKGINIPKIPMFAKGTEYFRGGKAIVGEQGAELVELPSGSKVHNANKTADLLGGNGGTVITGNNFTIREESDIKKVAKELYTLQRQGDRGRGNR